MVPAYNVTLGADVQAFESSKGQHLELEVLTLLVQHLQRWRQELGIDGKQDAGEEGSCFTGMLITLLIGMQHDTQSDTAAAVQQRSIHRSPHQ